MFKDKYILSRLFIACALFFLTPFPSVAGEKVLVKKIAFLKDNSLEISLSKKDTFKVFTLSDPNRLVVDIANAQIANPKENVTLPSFIANFRSTQSSNSLRLVFDLKQTISVKEISQNSNKITAKIIGPKVAKTLSKKEPAAISDFISNKVEEFDVSTTKVLKADGSTTYVVRKTPKAKVSNRKPIIVIDAGHGGKDPGTIGNYARSKEKNITLSYAKELAKQLGNTGRYKVYLTRDSDIFIPLRKRVEMARRKKADMFISLHANSISDSSVSGFSIYTLSEKSSDKQAALLAKKENHADIISGVNFSGASEDIMKTLIDLSQRETMNGSSRFANMAIDSVSKSSIKILQNTHRFAGFAVLAAPDMVSTLIEIGYLSNKSEEKLMNSLGYKRRLTGSLVQAIDEYFAKNKIN